MLTGTRDRRDDPDHHADHVAGEAAQDVRLEREAQAERHGVGAGLEQQLRRRR